MPDRRELNKIIFESLGLIGEEHLGLSESGRIGGE